MATYTTRLNLRKPEVLIDYVNVDLDLNANWNIIDNATRYNQNETITGNWKFEPTLTISSSTAQPLLDIINNSATARKPIIRFQTGTTPVTRFVVGVDDGDGNKFKISPSVLGTNDRLVIDSSGNVGIATSSPSATLCIGGNTLATTGYGLSIAGSVTTGRLLSAGSALISSIHTYYDNTAIEISAGSTSSYKTGVTIGARSFTGDTGIAFWTQGTKRIHLLDSGDLQLLSASTTISGSISGTGKSAQIELTSQNLINNGGLDVWDTSFPEGWQSASASNWNTGTNVTKEESLIVSPPYSAKLGDGTNNSRGMAQTSYFRVIPNSTYMFSAMFAGSETSNQAIVCFKAYDNNLNEITTGSPLGSDWVYSSSYGSWVYTFTINSTSFVKNSRVLTLSSDVNYLRLSIQFYTSGTVKYIYVDNIQLTKGSIIPDFTYKTLNDTESFNGKIFIKKNLDVSITDIQGINVGDNVQLRIFKVNIPAMGMLGGDIDVSSHRVGTGQHGGYKKYRIWFYRDSAGTLQSSSIAELTAFAQNGTIISDTFDYTQSDNTFTFRLQRDHNLSPDTRFIIKVNLFGYNISDFGWILAV